MSAKLTKQLLALDSRLQASSDYLLAQADQHVVRGFTYETPGNGLYIWTFSHPLYAELPGITLTFGARLRSPDDYIEFEPGNEKSLAIEILRRVEPYRAKFGSDPSLEEFLQDVWNLGVDQGGYPGRALNNPRRRAVYLATLVVLGRYGEAQEHVEILRQEALMKGDFCTQVGEWVRLFDDDPSALRFRLLEAEVTESRRLQLKPSGG